MAGKYGVKREGWPENGGTEAPMKVAGKIRFRVFFSPLPIFEPVAQSWPRPLTPSHFFILFFYFY